MNRIVLTLSGCVGLPGILTASSAKSPLTTADRIQESKSSKVDFEKELSQDREFLQDIDSMAIPSRDEVVRDPERALELIKRLRRLVLGDAGINYNRATKEPLVINRDEYVECHCSECQEFKTKAFSPGVDPEVIRQCCCLHSAFLLAGNYVERASTMLSQLGYVRREEVSRLSEQLAIKETRYSQLVKGLEIVGESKMKNQLPSFQLLSPIQNHQEQQAKDKIETIPQDYLAQQKNYLKKLEERYQWVSQNVSMLDFHLENILRLRARIKLLDKINSDNERAFMKASTQQAEDSNAKAEAVRKVKEQLNKSEMEAVESNEE